MWQRCGRCLHFESFFVFRVFGMLSQRNVAITPIVLQRVLDVHPTQPCQTSRSVHTSTIMCKMFEVPSRTEVDDLKQLYRNPKSLIDDLLQPLVCCGVTELRQVVVVPKLGGRYWRAKLQLLWPSKVTVSAVHNTVAGAEENVYLLACDLLKNMGLLYQCPSGGMVPVNLSYVLKILRTLHSSSCHPFSPSLPQFHFTTRPAALDSALPDQWQGSMPVSDWSSACWGVVKSGQKGVVKQLWRTDVGASWPYTFDVCTLGPSSHASKYAAALHTSIKLKAMGLLSSANCLATARLEVISRHQRSSVCREHYDPHFEIYSDASALGFGAYLLNRDDQCVHWLANTWSEHFPDCPRINPRQRQQTVGSSVCLESTFCELYAVVTACFTWKHKFVNKRVLVWTDSRAVVDMLNLGLHGEARIKRWGKLFSILAGTCKKYSIELRACHVQRQNNIAADMLSRYKLSAFKEAVPEAAPWQKKTKKLLFWNPLQSRTCDPHLSP